MKIGDLVVSLIIAVAVFLTIRGCQEKNTQGQALKECIEEVTRKCAGSIGYAIALESENARLNRKLGICRDKKRSD